MTLLEKAVEMTGWAPELIRDKLCPSDLEMEDACGSISAADATCKRLMVMGSCRVCWGRHVEDVRKGTVGAKLRAPAGRTEPLPPAAPPPKGEAG